MVEGVALAPKSSQFENTSNVQIQETNCQQSSWTTAVRRISRFLCVPVSFSDVPRKKIEGELSPSKRIPMTPRTPKDKVIIVRNILQTLEGPAEQLSRQLRKQVSKYVRQLKKVVCKESSNDAHFQDINFGRAVKGILGTDFISVLIHKYHYLEFEDRKVAATLIKNLIVQPVLKASVCSYFERNMDLLVYLMEGNNLQTMICSNGEILRHCLDHPRLVKRFLRSGEFMKLFKLMESPSFEVSANAYLTLKLLIQSRSRFFHGVLLDMYEEVFGFLCENSLYSSYLSKTYALKLSVLIIVHGTDHQSVKRFLNDTRFLQTFMNVFAATKRNLKNESYQIIKIFIANEYKPDSQKLLLAKYYKEIIQLITIFKPDADSEFLEGLEAEKEILIEIIVDNAKNCKVWNEAADKNFWYKQTINRRATQKYEFVS